MIGTKTVNFYLKNVFIEERRTSTSVIHTYFFYIYFWVVSFILFCFSILSVGVYSCVSVSVCVEYLNFMSYTSYQVFTLYQSYLALYCVGKKVKH